MWHDVAYIQIRCTSKPCKKNLTNINYIKSKTNHIRGFSAGLFGFFVVLFCFLVFFLLLFVCCLFAVLFPLILFSSFVIA